MSNTVQHAYKTEEKKKLVPAWFVYSENKGDKIIFSFVDIGEGIPQTIRKKFYEKPFLKDSDALISALSGESRTETKSKSRGKGLPYLRKVVEEGYIKQFKVVSEKGSCYYDETQRNFEKSDYKKPIFGTAFYWEIERRVV